MAGISSISSLLANLTTGDFSITTAEGKASTGSDATPPGGPVSIDFYQSTNDAQASEILQSATGWTSFPGAFDQTATDAVVTTSDGIEDLGTYSALNHGGIYGDAEGATWIGNQAGPAGLTPTFHVELERDSPDSFSATITAADGTVSTIEIDDPATPAAAAAATPVTGAAAAPVTAAAPAVAAAPVQSAPAAPAAFKLPAYTPPKIAATATATATDGVAGISFTFDAWGDFAATFASTNKGAASVLEITQSYSKALAVAPGSSVNTSG